MLRFGVLFVVVVVVVFFFFIKLMCVCLDHSLKIIAENQCKRIGILAKKTTQKIYKCDKQKIFRRKKTSEQNKYTNDRTNFHILFVCTECTALKQKVTPKNLKYK